MACSKPVSYDYLLDRLSCGVCMEQYDNGAHVPKILPCQHTFCLSCLNSIGVRGTVECPICRTLHQAPNRFTTNRVVLDIVDELEKGKDSSSGLMCSLHADADSVLLCIDCQEGLCIKCMKSIRDLHHNHHHHQLEEIEDARLLLLHKFESQAKDELCKLHSQIITVSQPGCSLSELAKAESDVAHMDQELVASIAKWRDQELSQIQKFKHLLNKQDELRTRSEALQTLLDQPGVDIRILIKELQKQESRNNQEQSDELQESPDSSDFASRREGLFDSICTEISSQENLTSEFLRHQVSQDNNNRGDVALDNTEVPTRSEDRPGGIEENEAVPLGYVTFGYARNSVHIVMYFLINIVCMLPFAFAYLNVSLQRFWAHKQTELRNTCIFTAFCETSEPVVTDVDVLSTTTCLLALHLFCTCICQVLSHYIVYCRGSTNGQNRPFDYCIRFLFVHSGMTALAFGGTCLAFGFETTLTPETIWYHCVASIIACAIQLIPGEVFKSVSNTVAFVKNSFDL